MKIEQNLGGKVTEGAAFDLHTGNYRIEVEMPASPIARHGAEFGMQMSADNGVNWQTAQQTPWRGAEPIPRLIQADGKVAEKFSFTAHFMSGLKYRFTTLSVKPIKIKLSRA